MVNKFISIHLFTCPPRALEVPKTTCCATHASCCHFWKREEKITCEPPSYHVDEECIFLSAAMFFKVLMNCTPVDNSHKTTIYCNNFAALEVHIWIVNSDIALHKRYMMDNRATLKKQILMKMICSGTFKIPIFWHKTMSPCMHHSIKNRHQWWLDWAYSWAALEESL